MLVTVIILTMIIVTVVVAGFVIVPRLQPKQVIYESEPDRPHPFGYRMGWLAIRTRDTQRVIERLGLTDPVTVNWNNGLGTVYSEADADSTVFVTPPVNGWTFVVGLAIPQPLGKAFVDKATALILDLGVHFIEVQYYLAYPAFDCFAWARVVNGKLLRAYAVNDEGVVWNKGRTSKEERMLGVKLYEVRGVKTRQGDAGGELVMYPTEQHVLQVAGKWGLDPSKLDTTTATGPAQGLIARTPNSWLPQTIRRAG